MRYAAIASSFVVLAAGTATAGVPVEVTVTGVVEFNQIGAPPLGDVVPGDQATLTFMLDSDVFMDSMNFPTRGYEIDQSSFVLTMGAVSIGLQDPFPAGETPYFVLRDNDPAVDGFFVATDLDFPIGVPINQLGIFEQFRNSYSVTYGGDTLDSLDILGALGTYDFDGLTVFNWTIGDGPFDAMGLIFEQMTITADLTAEAAVDIKPGSCPNSFNRKSNGVLPVAVLGGMDFDVSEIDPETIELTRADGMGGSVAPIRVRFGDVGAPFDGEPCDCGESEPDGYEDMKLKFRSRDVTNALELGMFEGGDLVELVISGYLYDGTPFMGTDCVRLVPVGHGRKNGRTR
ncbi:MAG: hypothetical protein ACYTJ0_03745 [Planctomycetota bacterium]|jgi:hypothetical protein